MKESGYFTQELSLEVASLSIVTIQLLVVLQVVACLAFEILFAKVLDFFNMWVFVRTSTNFAHLASFQAIEFVEWPIPKRLDILFVCQRSEIKAFYTKRSILWVLFAKNPQSPCFPLGAPSTMTALRSMCLIPSLAFVSGVVYNTERGKKWKFEFGESTGKLGLKMTNITHTDERKMVQLYHLVPVCVISMFKFIFINRSTLAWSGEKSHCTLALKARWCNHTWFFRRTAKNLVAYATSWSLTLSPVKQTEGIEEGRITKVRQKSKIQSQKR